jgi:hypothetical protein
MPGKEQFQEWAITQIRKEIDEGSVSPDWYDAIQPQEIWVSPEEKENQATQKSNTKARKAIEQIMKEYESQEKLKPKSDTQRLRDEMMRELRDIKKAIHTLGILLESDEPSQEDLSNHATLREAYRKYKMIEALTLGKK